MARYAEDARRANGPIWGLGGKLRVVIPELSSRASV